MLKCEEDIDIETVDDFHNSASQSTQTQQATEAFEIKETLKKSSHFTRYFSTF